MCKRFVIAISWRSWTVSALEEEEKGTKSRRSRGATYRTKYIPFTVLVPPRVLPRGSASFWLAAWVWGTVVKPQSMSVPMNDAYISVYWRHYRCADEECGDRGHMIPTWDESSIRFGQMPGLENGDKDTRIPG